MNFPLITTLTLVPIFGAVVVAGLDSQKKSLARLLALGFSLISLLLAIVLWRNFDASSSALQFV